MSKQNFIKGTFILTCTGLASRVIGFFYRIFLSHSIGAQGLGLYQLMVPLQNLVLALTTSGIQTALNRLEERGMSFDFIFMDPPYNHLYEKQVLERLSGSPLIKENTLIIAEASRETDTSYIPSLGFCISRVKEYKTNKHLFITPARRLGDS